MSCEISAAVAYSETALRLNERLHDSQRLGLLSFLHGCTVVPWKKHVATALPCLVHLFDGLFDGPATLRHQPRHHGDVRDLQRNVRRGTRADRFRNGLPRLARAIADRELPPIRRECQCHKEVGKSQVE